MGIDLSLSYWISKTRESITKWHSLGTEAYKLGIFFPTYLMTTGLFSISMRLFLFCFIHWFSFFNSTYKWHCIVFVFIWLISLSINTLQNHPCCYKWHNFIHFCGLVVFYYVCVYICVCVYIYKTFKNMYWLLINDCFTILVWCLSYINMN